jgi:hypothetical protein
MTRPTLVRFVAVCALILASSVLPLVIVPSPSSAASHAAKSADCPYPGAVVSSGFVTTSEGGTAYETQVCGLPDRSATAASGSSDTDQRVRPLHATLRPQIALTKNPGISLCQNYDEWVLLDDSTTFQCAPDTPGNYTPIEYPLELVNNTFAQVWLYQNANGTGWKDCFDWGQMYILGGRDISPGDLYVSGNPSLCSANGTGNQSTQVCSGPQVFFSGLLALNSVSQDQCFSLAGTHTNLKTPTLAVLNMWAAQVLETGTQNGMKWSDCYDYGNAQAVAGDRESYATAIENTSNTNKC